MTEFTSAPPPAAEPGNKRRRELITVVVVVAILLCCCCIVIPGAILAYYCGDVLTGAATECSPLPFLSAPTPESVLPAILALL